MNRKRSPKIPCINNAFQMHLRVNLCKTCINFKRERDFYKERCRIYERQNEELYKQLNNKKGRFLNNTNTHHEACECCTCKKLPAIFPCEDPSPPDTIKLEENQAEDPNGNPEVANALYPAVRELPADIVETSAQLIGWPMVPHGELALHLEQEREQEKILERAEIPEPREIVQVKLEEVEPEEEEKEAEENASIPLTCCWVLNHLPGRWRRCGKVFKAVHEIVPHIRDEHDSPSGNYVCYWPDCERMRQPFKIKLEFLMHINRMHTGEVRYSCPIEDCSETFMCWDEVDAHKKEHDEIKVYCLYPGCAKVFSNTARVHDHYRICHMGARSYKCPVESCGELFSSTKALAKHERGHELTKPLQCEFPGCEKTFTDKLSLELHEWNHEQEFDNSWREHEGNDDISDEVLAKRFKAGTGEEDNLESLGVTDDGDSSEGSPRKALGPCRKGCSTKISPELQKALYDEYWSLGEYKARKMYLCSLIEVKRRTDSPYRQKLRKPTLHDFNQQFFVPINGDRIEVCKMCFGRIFGEKQYAVDRVTLEIAIAAHPNPVME